MILRKAIEKVEEWQKRKVYICRSIVDVYSVSSKNMKDVESKQKGKKILNIKICKFLISEFLISSAAADPPKHSEGGNQIPINK